MTAALVWAELNQSHLPGLQNFVCTDPVKPRRDSSTGWQPVHPRLYEYDAQQMIRALGKRVRHGPECRVLVGSDSGGIAAVTSWTELEGPAWVHLDVMGVAQRLRKPGEPDVSRRVGTTAMSVALGSIEAAALSAGEHGMYVEGEVYRENTASLRMVEHFGFTFVVEAQTGAQTWALDYRFTL